MWALGGPLTPEAVTTIHHMSRGIPLYARELVAAAHWTMTDRGWELAAPAPTPPSLLELVADRFAALGKREREALETLAFAQPVPMQAAAAMAHHDVLADLERAGLVTVNEATDPATVQLAHPVFDEVIRSRLGPLQQRRSALRAAESLEALPRSEGLPLRAAQLRRQYSLPLPAPAALDAARRAMSVVHPELAEDLLTDVESCFDVDLLRAIAVGAQGRYEEADRLFLGVETLADDDERRARVAADRANILRASGRFGAAVAVLEAASATVEDRRWVGYLGTAIAYTKRWAGADGRTDIGDNDDGFDHLVGAVLAVMDGRLSETERIVERGTPLMAALEADVPAARTLLALSQHLAAAFAGRSAEAERIAARELERTVAESHAAGTDVVAAAPGLWRGVQGLQALFDGDLSRALVDLEAAEGFLRHADIAGMRPLARAAAACVLAEQGRSEASLDRERSIEADWREETKVGCVLAMADAWRRAAAGDVDGAAATLVRAARSALDNNHVVFAALAAHDALRLDRARTVMPVLDEIAARWEGALAATITDHGNALVGDDPDALLAVASAYPELGFRVSGAEAAMQSSRRYAKRGATGAAIHAEYVASTLVAPLGECCRTVLGHPRGLTGREHQIADMVAAGASSRDVAARLNVSSRTVDNHLASVYRKLGIGGRRDLLGWAEKVAATKPQSQVVEVPPW